VALQGRQAVQVIVFISRDPSQEGHVPSLLVLPDQADAAIPRHLQGIEWRYFATTSTTDRLLARSRVDVERELAAEGYAIVATREN
jgi:hypothetical protein